jgi:ribA/ribD-fused uncharacterized protein
MAELTLKDLMDRLNTMNYILTEVKEQVNKCKEGIKTCNEKCDSVLPRVCALEKDMAFIKREVHALKEKNLQMESYLRRDNLLFGGISESNPENCEEKVRFFIKNILQVPCDDMRFVRVHRLGKREPNKVRPIVARFHYFGDRQIVFRKRGTLNDTDKWMAEDFPWEIQQRRRVMKPILRKAVAELGPDKAYLTGDRLVIAGVSYTFDKLTSLPPEFKLENVATPHIGENFVAFYNASSPFSNFYRAKFTIGGTEYAHVEQYFTASKAKITGNGEMYRQIMQEDSPYRCKALAKQLQNSVEWKREQEKVMETGCAAKFEQNAHLLNFLLQTEQKTLIEARADDKFWGAGLKHTDPKLVAEKVPGKNKLGKILMKIRSANTR